MNNDVLEVVAEHLEHSRLSRGLAAAGVEPHLSYWKDRDSRRRQNMSADSAAIGLDKPDMAKETRPIGAVGEQLVRLVSVVDNLATLPGVLEGRLEPVLDRVEPSVKDGGITDKAPERRLAPMAEDIQALCVRLEDTFESLSTLARRVSV